LNFRIPGISTPDPEKPPPQAEKYSHPGRVNPSKADAFPEGRVQSV
jgi:hypothetical protein